ncbi:MAG: hypothetical protein V4674_00420 [Patescibacteria group bacterium]
MKLADPGFLLRVATEIPRAASAGSEDKDEHGRLEVYEAFLSSLGPDSATNSGELSLLQQIYRAVQGTLRSKCPELPFYHWSRPVLEKIMKHLEKIIQAPHVRGIEGMHSAAPVW